MQREKVLQSLRALKNGVHPISGETLSGDALLHLPEIREAISYALKWLSVEERTSEDKKNSRWSDEEDQKLLSLLDSGVSPEMVAKELGRSLSSLSQRLQRLGKGEDYQ